MEHKDFAVSQIRALRAQQPFITPEAAHQRLRCVMELKTIKLWQVKDLFSQEDDVLKKASQVSDGLIYIDGERRSDE